MSPKKQAHTPILHERYEQLIREGLRDDAGQRTVVAELDVLVAALSGGKKGLLSIFGKAPSVPHGLYIWGNVGRGKSMLMDMFFTAAPVAKKRRVHFHAFMQEVHARIHVLRQREAGDPVAIIAREMADEYRLLCFDELQATDVADASLLFRLFEGLFAQQVVVVSTSNHPPATLYTGGVQRERFDKFIALLNTNMKVVALSSPADYRHLQLKDMRQTYFHPLGREADRFVAQTLERICPGHRPKRETLNVHGRELTFDLYDDSIGRFTFAQLCESALGPADYLTLAQRLDTLILTGIPALPPEKRNEAKRFVTLVDALYEANVKLIATAETEPAGIYGQGDGSFEFHRTVSRLAEMQSTKYLEADHS